MINPIFWRHRLETISALGAIGWGLWLLNPFHNAFGITANLRVMALVAPENIWGVAAVGFGVLSLVGMYKRNRKARRVAMFFVLWFRLLTFIMVGIQTKFVTTGIPDFFLWTAMAAMAYMSIDHDA